MLSAADLADWSGIDNDDSPNDYAVLSPVSAGGEFDARRYGGGQSAAYLADTSLSVSGGVLTSSTSGGFGATGTIAFDASTDNTSLADPVFYFGFFDKDDLTAGAFGFSIADQSTSSFRFRASAGTTQTSGSGTVVSEGTYTFDLDVNNTDSGANKVRFRLFDPITASSVLDVNVTIPGSGTPTADSFGFLQPVATSGSDVTFGMTLSEINYAGESEVVVPTAPSDLSATAAEGQISLIWQDNATNEMGYTIERRIESTGTWEELATLAADSTMYVNTGLSDGTTYYYRVRASIGSVVSDWSNEASATTPSAPAAPSNASASAAQGQVTVTWTDNSNNETGFTVERRVGTDGAWEQIAAVGANETGYIDTGLSAATTYYYRVQAWNGTLASAYSNEASDTTPSATGVADLSSFVGSGNTASPNNYLADVTSMGGIFDARRYGGGQSAAYLADTSLSVSGGVLTSATSGGFGATGTIAFDASTDNTSLADPVFYFGFFDKDDLTAGAFGFSIADQSTSSFRFRASAGTTQTSGSGTVVSEGTYTFDLDVNNTDSGANKVRFRLFDPITASSVLDVNVTIPGSGTPTADSFGFLQPVATSGSEATFGMTLSEINYSGETLVSVPSAPSDLSATAATGQITLDWQNNATNATGHTIERKIGSGGTWTELATVEAEATTYVDAGLSDGTTYYYRIRSFNSAGASAWSSEASATTPTAPMAPSNLAATEATRQVSLSWQDNSSNETAFVIQRKVGAGSFTQLTTVGANVTSYTDTGLSDGTTYTYRILSQNATGDSDWSNEASATTPAASIPAAPAGLSATATTGQVDLAWTDNSDNENGFAVERRIGSSGAWTLITTTAANATSYSNTGLADATTYYYRVRAVNGAGSSPYTNEVWATTPAATGVADLSGFTGSGNTSAPNNYTASTTAAGGTFDARRFGSGEAAAYLADTSLAVTGNVLTKDTSGGFGASGTITFDASLNNTSLADPVLYLGFFDKDDLTAGAFGVALADSTTSAFRFRAIAGTIQTTGSGVVSNEGTYTFDLDVNNTDSGANKIRFRLFTGATAVLDVSVTIPTGLSLEADSFGFLQPLATSDSDVTFGLSVANVNYTGETLITGTPTAPAAPTNLTASAGAQQVSLNWVDNSNNETGFVIERKVGAGSYSQLVVLGANVTSYVNTGLTAGTTYTYRVKAQNSAGSSSFSNEVSAVPTSGATAPSAPSNLAATPSSGQVSLSWTDNSSNETNFSVERRLGTTGAWTVIATPAANATSYVDNTVDADTTYNYRVRAQNGSLNSNYSNIESATTPVASSIFYISTSGSDANNGTSTSTPWATLDEALQSAPANSIVYLRGGTYGAQTTLTDPGRTGKVTFKPYQDEVVTFTGLIDWKLVTDVRLEGLNFVNTHVQIRETERFEFVNNDMTNGGLNVYGIDGGLVEGNYFHGYTSENNAILFRSHNRFLIPGSVSRDFRTDNVTVRGNTVDMNNKPGDGIHLENGANALIEKNDIKNVVTTSAQHGDSIQLVEINSSTITGNIMGPGRGIIVHHFRNGDGSIMQPYIPGVNYDLVFTNNVHTGSQFSLRLQEAPNAIVTNNTFWGTSTSAGSGLDIANSSNVIVVNNILKTFRINANTTFSVRGNNLISSTAFLYGTTLQSAEGEITGTPSFVNLAARDVRLQSGSLGIDDGRTGSWVPSLDFDGNARVGLPDLGAFEFQP